MKYKLIFLTLVLFCLILSGCVSGDNYYQRKAEQKLADTLEEYNAHINIVKEYDADCLKNWCINTCMTEKSDISDAQAKSVKCNMECNKVEMIEINAAEYPQCKKDSTTVNTQDEDCPIVYKCKNPIREDNIEKCPESELQEYRERCMS